MDRQQYIEILLEHYESPRHRGPLPDATVTCTGSNPGCGDVITIYLKVDASGTATQIQFEGEGCTISQGAVSILLDMAQGKTLAEILAMDYNDWVEKLGKKVVLTRVRCATLGLKTLQEAILQYQARQPQVST